MYITDLQFLQYSISFLYFKALNCLIWFKKKKINNLNASKEKMPLKRKYISNSIKKQVCRLQEYKCSSCLIMLPYTYNIYHIIPWAMSQDNNIENLQALCPNCHALKTVNDRKNIIEWKNESKMEID
jgi:hypothetical protein